MADLISEKDLNKLIVVGDRILIRPRTATGKTKSGLYLPPGVEKKEDLYSGYVLRVGPGYPVPAIMDTDEPWKDPEDNVKYVPLQPREGDLAVYLQKNSFEFSFNGEKLVIVPHGAILLLYRDDELLK